MKRIPKTIYQTPAELEARIKQCMEDALLPSPDSIETARSCGKSQSFDMPYSATLEFIHNHYSEAETACSHKLVRIELESQAVETLARARDCLARSYDALAMPMPWRPTEKQ